MGVVSAAVVDGDAEVVAEDVVPVVVVDLVQALTASPHIRTISKESNNIFFILNITPS